MLLSSLDLEMRETDILVQPDIIPPFPLHIRISLCLIFLLLPLIACTELSEYDNQQIQSTINDSLLTTTESWDVEMMLTQGGRKRIFVEGSYAINYQTEENKHTNISGPVYVQIYDSTGAIESEAWSIRATYLESEAEFELFDSVRVETHDNNQLYSEYLKWSQDTDRISSPDFVTIITPQDSISGKGFDGLTDLSDYNIIEPRGRLTID